MKWKNYMKERYKSIMLGGTLLGVVLGVIAFGIVYLVCGHFDIGQKFLLSFFSGLFVAVIAIIGNHHYVANKLMMIEAIETLDEIKKSLSK